MRHSARRPTWTVILLAATLSACASERPAETGIARADTIPGRPSAQDSRAVAVARVLREARVGSYLNESIAGRDPSAAVRWDTDRHPRLKVFVPPAVRVPGFDRSFHGAVQSAFAAWQTTGLPIRFELSPDSVGALVHLRWIEQFDGDRTGEAFVRWVLPSGWIQGGTLTLATHTPDGVPLDREQVYAVALHEIGHLLGLGHSPRGDDVMHPVTTAHILSSRDRRTAQLLYAMPPGEVVIPR